jgi:hypothetical protein
MIIFIAFFQLFIMVAILRNFYLNPISDEVDVENVKKLI